MTNHRSSCRSWIFPFLVVTLTLLCGTPAAHVEYGKEAVRVGRVLSTNSWRKTHQGHEDFSEHDLEEAAAALRKTFHHSLRFGRGRALADGVEGQSATCPLNLRDFPEVRFAITDSCSKDLPSQIAPNNTWPPVSPAACCNIVLTAYSILQAEWTTSSKYFRLENEALLRTCVGEFAQRVLKDTGRDVEDCFSDSYFRYSQRDPSLCGPKTVEEYEAVLGKSSLDTLRGACQGNLLEAQACGICSENARSAYAQVAQAAVKNNVTLNKPDGNVSDVNTAKTYDCIYVTVTYIAGVMLRQGPADPGVQKCLYIMPLAPSGDGSNHIGLVLGVTVAAVVVLLLAACTTCVWWRKKRGLAAWYLIPNSSRKSGFLPVQRGGGGGVVLFDYDEIKTATDNFSPANHIGSGGFGSVYKGVMTDGTVIAVKRLKNCSSEGEAEFVNEVEVINRVRHRNLVRLRGCCVIAGTLDEGHQRLLVYDFLPGGSLHDHLFSSALFGKKSGGLSWPERQRIAVDIARGLAYLHNDTQPPIFHRDIKASNVLLDKDYKACVADFGLARLTLEGQSHMTASTVAGTHGYMAPEYAMYGKLTGKSDVYSFGVVLLEIMSGRKALDSSQIATPRFLISDWCWTVLESEGSVSGVIDERIRDYTNPQVLAVQERFVITGMLCSHSHDAMRPTMADALQYLEGDLPVPSLPSTPAPLYAETSTFKKYLGDSTTGTTGTKGSSSTVTGSFSAVLSIQAEPR